MDWITVRNWTLSIITSKPDLTWSSISILNTTFDVLYRWWYSKFLPHERINVLLIQRCVRRTIHVQCNPMQWRPCHGVNFDRQPRKNKQNLKEKCHEFHISPRLYKTVSVTSANSATNFKNCWVLIRQPSRRKSVGTVRETHIDRWSPKWSIWTPSVKSAML